MLHVVLSSVSTLFPNEAASKLKVVDPPTVDPIKPHKLGWTRSLVGSTHRTDNGVRSSRKAEHPNAQRSGSSHGVLNSAVRLLLASDKADALDNQTRCAGLCRTIRVLLLIKHVFVELRPPEGESRNRSGPVSGVRCCN